MPALWSAFAHVCLPSNISRIWLGYMVPPEKWSRIPILVVHKKKSPKLAAGGNELAVPVHYKDTRLYRAVILKIHQNWGLENGKIQLCLLRQGSEFPNRITVILFCYYSTKHEINLETVLKYSESYVFYYSGSGLLSFHVAQTISKCPPPSPHAHTF